jgi:hypothetical protein
MFQTNIVEIIKIYFMFQNFFFFENHAFYEIMWKNTVEPNRLQMTIWRMRIACWIPKATNTHSDYVMLNLSHCNNGCTNALQCYVIHTLPGWLIIEFPVHLLKN